MKKIICCFTLLLIVLGCEQDNPDAQSTPGKQYQKTHQDKDIADTNKPQKTQIDAPSLGKTFTNSIGMKLVYIPHGEFMMGSRDSATEVARNTKTEPVLYADEHPRHRVKITKGFYMGTTEVTQFQYKEIMEDNPSHFRSQNSQVVNVSWNNAVEFCTKLSEEEGEIYRLPTEAEWEYACRAGTTTPFYTGETISTDQANYDGNFIYGSGTTGIYRKKTIEVGSFPPNAFGLYDMHGNVWEWCQDWYGENYYASSPISNPQGPTSGTERVLRGGSWSHHPWRCRSAFRGGLKPDTREGNYAFRIVLDLN